MNNHQIKHDGSIIISERGLVYFIIIIALVAALAFFMGYRACVKDVELIAIERTTLYMEAFRDSIAINRAIADSALVQAGASLAFSKAIMKERHR